MFDPKDLPPLNALRLLAGDAPAVSTPSPDRLSIVSEIAQRMLTGSTPPPLGPPFTAAAEIGRDMLTEPPPLNLLVNPYRARPVPPPRTYSLFISHAWDYGDDYTGLIGLISDVPSFAWINKSIPKEQAVVPNPFLKKSNRQLIREIDARIGASDCLVVIAGMYCKYREWIQSEIEAAQEFGKPIIAVKRWGQDRMPLEVALAAGKNVVGWRTESIVRAIRTLVR